MVWVDFRDYDGHRVRLTTKDGMELEGRCEVYENCNGVPVIEVSDCGFYVVELDNVEWIEFAD